MSSNRVVWIMVAWTLAATGVVHAEPEGNPKNGLSATAFKQNSLLANPDSVAALVGGGLSTATVRTSMLNTQLHDRAARAVFTELVRCAFPSSYVITYTDPFTQTATAFSGELGLCNGGWETAAPTQACQQLVSACIMSRVNVLNQAVPISIRPQTITAKPTRHVNTETSLRVNSGPYDPAQGTLIQPFYTLGVFGADFGWKPAYVGACSSIDGTVSLQIKDQSKCNMPMRVCNGLEGCINGYWPTPDPELYPDATDVMGQSSSTCTKPLKITCFTNSNFSVMVQVGSSGTAPTVTMTAGDASYPAQEADVFVFREGAFYGNLFKWSTTPLPWTCAVDPSLPNGPPPDPNGTVPPGWPYCMIATPGSDRNAIPYPYAYACYSAGTERTGDSTSGAAYLNSRMCADPHGGYKCFPHGLSRCWYGNSDAGKCQWDATRGVFHDCAANDDLSTTYQAVTTYLNDTCDLSAGGICEPSGAGVPSIKRVDDREGADEDRGGCSAGGSTGVASLALALAFVIRRRRSQRS